MNLPTKKEITEDAKTMTKSWNIDIPHSHIDFSIERRLMMNKPQDDFLHTEAFQWCEKPKQKDMTKVEYLVFGLAIGMLLTVGLQMLSTWI